MIPLSHHRYIGMFTLLNSYNDYHILSKIYFSIKILSFVNLILPTYPRIIRQSKRKLNIQRNLLVGQIICLICFGRNPRIAMCGLTDYDVANVEIMVILYSWKNSPIYIPLILINIAMSR